MIRWYDWVAAVVLADLLLALGLASLNSTDFWANILYGLLAGFFYNAWADTYCNFRKRVESRK